MSCYFPTCNGTQLLSHSSGSFVSASSVPRRKRLINVQEVPSLDMGNVKDKLIRRGPAKRSESFDPAMMSSGSRKAGLQSSDCDFGENECMSMPQEAGGKRVNHNADDSAEIGKSDIRGTAWFPRARLFKKSMSMPVEKTEFRDSGKVIQDSRTSNGKKPGRRLPLDFLRKSSPPEIQKNDCASKDSSTEESGGPSDVDDDSSQVDQSLLRRTQIVPQQTSPVSPRDDEVVTRQHTPKQEEVEAVSEYSCATAILQHSYLERMCWRQYNTFSFDDAELPSLALPEDPTVQESIECIFASQLEEGLEMWDDGDDEHAFESAADRPEGLVSPATVLQSRQNRSDRHPTSLSQSKKRYQQASLVYVGTFDPTIADEDKSVLEHYDNPLPCPCAKSSLPPINPKDWPQAPLLLRPTPGSGTRVKGVRFANTKDRFWEPESAQSWSEHLAKSWGIEYEPKPRYGSCEKCAIIPINNGNEKRGESLVVDFESDLFEGSLLLRLRFSEGTTKERYDDSKGYFAGMNRRYQAVVRGRFKKVIPFTELVTGFQFNRPCGQLPPKWILRSGLKVISFFAPQLQAKFEGCRPYSFTPLGSTPQSISVEAEESDLIEDFREEPTLVSNTLTGEVSLAASSLHRARARKKTFDKLYVQKSPDPKTDLSRIYTFEFLQHLFNFENFSIELGSMLGSVQLEDILDGQPLQVMATHGDERLWSFDIWHECLWEKAKVHDK